MPTEGSSSRRDSRRMLRVRTWQLAATAAVSLLFPTMVVVGIRAVAATAVTGRTLWGGIPASLPCAPVRKMSDSACLDSTQLGEVLVLKSLKHAFIHIYYIYTTHQRQALVSSSSTTPITAFLSPVSRSPSSSRNHHRHHQHRSIHRPVTTITTAPPSFLPYPSFPSSSAMAAKEGMVEEVFYPPEEYFQQCA